MQPRAVRLALVALALSTPNPVVAQAPGAYEVVVQNVDASKFPEVKVEFQVFTKDVNAPTWQPSMGIKVLEGVLGSTKDGKEVSAIERCSDPRDIVLGIAIDVSGSVSDVLPQMQQGIVAAFRKMEGYTDTEDTGAVFAFSTGGVFRFPQETANPAYIGDTRQVETAVQSIQAGGGSPIWAGMRTELDRLLPFRADDKKVKRLLATFTDGQDNQSSMADAMDLLQKAQRGGATMVMLGYGDDQNTLGMEMLAKASGGVYVPGASGNVEKALSDVIEAIRNTWCVTYKSPHPNIVNEPATTTVVTGGSQGSARYPLPFVIPEDTRQVELYMPVSKFAYTLLAAGSAMPFVEVAMEYVDAAGAPVAQEAGPARAEKKVQFMVPPAAWKCQGDDCGFYVRRYDYPDKWDQLFRVPTDKVSLHDDDTKLVIDGVRHYSLKTKFHLEGFDQGAGRDYPSATRVSVQDRTPPAVWMQVRPQDGAAPLSTRVLEAAIDQDPGLFGGGRPTYEGARTVGQGAKQAQVQYAWRDPQGGEVQGRVEGQHWALWTDRPDDDDLIPETAVFRTDEAAAMVDDTHGIFEYGLRVPAGTRMSLEIAARDNYAGLTASGRTADQAAFTSPGTDPVAGPVHARFDMNEPEAQPGSSRAPYLTARPRAELEADLGVEGVAWWIEDLTGGALQDRYVGLEGLTEIVYPGADEDVRDELAARGEFLPPGPLRMLKIRAQDGNGNVTLEEFPLYVEETSFSAKTLEYRSRREQLSGLPYRAGGVD